MTTKSIRHMTTLPLASRPNERGDTQPVRSRPSPDEVVRKEKGRGHFEAGNPNHAAVDARDEMKSAQP